MFIVSSVQLEAAPSGNGSGSGISVEIRKAPGQKCERCWNYSTQVGSDPEVSDGLRALQRGPEGDRNGSSWTLEPSTGTHAMRKYHFLIAVLVIVLDR